MRVVKLKKNRDDRNRQERVKCVYPDQGVHKNLLGPHWDSCGVLIR